MVLVVLMDMTDIVGVELDVDHLRQCQHRGRPRRWVVIARICPVRRAAASRPIRAPGGTGERSATIASLVMSNPFSCWPFAIVDL
jgi:hypothetical protein